MVRFETFLPLLNRFRPTTSMLVQSLLGKHQQQCLFTYTAAGMYTKLKVFGMVLSCLLEDAPVGARRQRTATFDEELRSLKQPEPHCTITCALLLKVAL